MQPSTPDNSPSQPLTGGDGLPRQRGTKLADDIYLVNANNWEYLSGRWSRPIAKIPLWFGCLSSFFVFTLSIPVFILFLGGRGITFELIAWLGISIVCLVIYLSEYALRYYVSVRGILLIGQITAIHGHWQEKLIGRYKRVAREYHFRIDYCVRLPNGTLGKAWHSGMQSEQSNIMLLKQGTSVFVVYIPIMNTTFLL